MAVGGNSADRPVASTSAAAVAPTADHNELNALYEAGRLRELQTAARRQAAILAETAAPLSEVRLIRLVRMAENVCLPPVDIGRLLQRLEPFRERVSGLSEARAAAEARQKFRVETAAAVNERVCLIPLGLQCLPFVVLNRWGLRSYADFRACLNPFAMAWHSIDGVIDALEGDFSDYCRPADITASKTATGELIMLRKDRNAVWNHYFGESWTKNDFAPLVVSMNERIESFRESCRRPNAVFLISHLTVNYPDEPLTFLPRLQEAIRRRSGHHDNRLILTSQNASGRPNRQYRVDDTTTFLSCPFPTKGYAWNDPNVVDSPEGVDYERGYVQMIQDALREWRLIPGQTLPPATVGVAR